MRFVAVQEPDNSWAVFGVTADEPADYAGSSSLWQTRKSRGAKASDRARFSRRTSQRLPIWPDACRHGFRFSRPLADACYAGRAGRVQTIDLSPINR